MGDRRIIIVGTGFSGICMGIKLKEAGIHSFNILEKAAETGGTWRDNTYPGAACDVKSHLYSFSFELNPNWSRVFSPQQEIWDYLRHCVKKYKLEEHIKFNWELKGLKFNDADSTWTLFNTKGEKDVADVVILGTGGLHLPNIPDIEGLKNFKGKIFHSAQWDHSYDLKGKEVAVIGTGASAIQFVPKIQPLVKKLCLFQRTAPWILPKPDAKISEFRKKLYWNFPFLMKLYRNVIYLRNESFLLGFTINQKLLNLGEKIALWHLKKHVKDQELRKKLTPNFRLGCKRALLDNEYYPAIAKPNVEVITDGIERMGEDFVLTKKGERKKLDAIIFGTGFHVVDSFTFLDVKGKGGIDLNEIWKDGPEAYLGTTVSGFPNLFFMTGPNTGLGHNSLVYMIEAQVTYIVDCLKKIFEKNLKQVEVKKDVQDEFNREIDKKSKDTVWISGCRSWYLTPSGRNAAIWPTFTFTFKNRTKKMNPADYILT